MKGLIVSSILSMVLPSSTMTYVKAPDPVEKYEIVKAEISGYSSSIEETDDTPLLTASGTAVREGTLACPSRLSFGTSVEIEGRFYKCEDRMNRRYRDSEVYDIWFTSKESAYQWGRKSLDIKVYEGDKNS